MSLKHSISISYLEGSWGGTAKIRMALGTYAVCRPTVFVPFSATSNRCTETKPDAKQTIRAKANTWTLLFRLRHRSPLASCARGGHAASFISMGGSASTHFLALNVEQITRLICSPVMFQRIMSMASGMLSLVTPLMPKPRQIPCNSLRHKMSIAGGGRVCFGRW